MREPYDSSLSEDLLLRYDKIQDIHAIDAIGLELWTVGRKIMRDAISAKERSKQCPARTSFVRSTTMPPWTTERTKGIDRKLPWKTNAGENKIGRIAAAGFNLECTNRFIVVEFIEGKSSALTNALPRLHQQR